MTSSPDQFFCLRWNNHRENFIEAFDQLLVNEIFTDVTLVVENGIFVKCHKMVLAACSSYFQDIFTDLPHTHSCIVLRDIKYAEIKDILQYMYTGQVKVAQEHLEDLLRVAELLNVKGLVPNEPSSSFTKPAERYEEAISTSTSNTMRRNHRSRENSSPPHSTSSPYYSHRRSPSGRHNQIPNVPLSIWSQLPASESLGQNSASALPAPPSQLSCLRRYPSLYSTLYDNTVEASTTHNRSHRNSNNGANITRNNDTPILRTVLGQGHVDSSISNNQSDGHENRNHSNGSANNEIDGRRTSTEVPNWSPSHSPYATDTSMMEEDEKKTSPSSSADDPPSANPNPRPEWKRYKQYTREDIANAIDAVRNGMSALQAARNYCVPSRTLYDKVKKLGITTTRPMRRGSHCHSAASFPYGIGGNINGSIYNNISESDNDTRNATMHNPASLLETAFSESRENSRDREAIKAIAQTSPSPQQLPHYSQQPMSVDELPQQNTIDDNDNQVEDLSVNRRSDVRVIMSPSTAIKEEN